MWLGQEGPGIWTLSSSQRVFLFKSPAQCWTQINFSVKVGRIELTTQTFEFLNEIQEGIKLWKQYNFRSKFQIQGLDSLE